MDNSEIRGLLTRLRDEIQQSELDDETRRLMSELDADIHDLLDPDTPDVEPGPILERAREIDANFRAEHPTAVRILNEVMATLSRMGI